MLQYLFRRSNIENTYRSVPALKKFCRAFGSAIVEADESQSERHSDIDRYRQRKKYEKNFIENLFLGIFEPKVLEYPQIRTKEEIDYLRKHGERANHVMLHGIDCEEIETTGKISKATLERLQEKDLIGMKIKLKDEGLGYLESESYYIQESLYLSSSLGKIVTESENSGYQILRLFGTDTQKTEYIPKFLKGECVSSLAHLEHGTWLSQCSSPISTIAVEEADGSFVISGQKSLVCNPNASDILIVSAMVNNEKVNNSYTLFMVDKNSKGLSVLEPLDKFSLKGTEMCDVVFDKVIVPAGNIIGKVNEGDKIIDKLISQGKLSNGAQCIGVMRKLVNDAITHCIINNHFCKPLHSYKYIQGKIGEIIQALYAAESMTYLMTGRVDHDPDLNVKLESLIVKIFNSEALNFIVYNYMHLVGRDKCNDELLDRIIRDSPYFTAFDDPNLYLKMILATNGINYTFNQMSHPTVKNYKPMNKIKLKYIDQLIDYKMRDTLQGYLHLTLKMESSLLFFCTEMLNFLTELLINEHGIKTNAAPYYLSQLAELTIIIYKLTAVLGRASRSYCIGLRHSDKDIRMARNITQNGYQRALTIRHNVSTKLRSAPTYKYVGEYVSASGKICHKHPAEPVRKTKTPT